VAGFTGLSTGHQHDEQADSAVDAVVKRISGQ
jgi:hypothetical protein